MNREKKPSTPSFNDFTQRQLFFQSVDRTIEPAKPLRCKLNDISLKPVERRAFGVISDQQVDRMKLSTTAGSRKTFPKPTEAKGVMSYDSALEFRPEPLPEKVNLVRNAKPHARPQEFVARTINSCKVSRFTCLELNKEKVYSVNWVMSDDTGGKDWCNNENWMAKRVQPPKRKWL